MTNYEAALRLADLYMSDDPEIREVALRGSLALMSVSDFVVNDQIANFYEFIRSKHEGE